MVKQLANNVFRRKFYSHSIVNPVTPPLPEWVAASVYINATVTDTAKTIRSSLRQNCVGEGKQRASSVFVEPS